MRRHGTRRRGFTLVELMTYLALVTSASIVIGGIEFAATRATFLEQALVEIGRRGDLVGKSFRADVRQATNVTIPSVRASGPNAHGTILILAESNGGETRYEVEAAQKLETIGATVHGQHCRLLRTWSPRVGQTPEQREIIEEVEKLDLVRETKDGTTRLLLQLTLAYGRGNEVTARRMFQFSSSPIAEESP